MKLISADIAFQVPLLGEIYDLFEDFMPIAGKFLDIVTWHWYPCISSKEFWFPYDPWLATPSRLMDPSVLDLMDEYAADVQRHTAKYAPNAQIW